jgi:hypothetical protein
VVAAKACEFKACEFKAAKSRQADAKKAANKAKKARLVRRPYLSCRCAVIVGINNIRVEGTLDAT